MEKRGSRPGKKISNAEICERELGSSEWASLDRFAPYCAVSVLAVDSSVVCVAKGGGGVRSEVPR